MTRRTATPEDRIAIEWHARVRAKDESLSPPEPLAHFKDVHAWVLIADPGSGKSDAFQTLADDEGGYYISARNFVELGAPPHWSQPIFIDGLDEITGGGAATTPLGQIRSRLHALGTPKFRISCREADWRGNTDGKALSYMVGEDNFLELHLAPLDATQIEALVMHWLNSDEAAALAFVRAAKDHDLEGLLDNPQTLRMLVKAVGTADKSWPDSKTQTYEMACGQLVREHNAEHLAAQRQHTLPDSKVLDAAGYLSAILLLSGNTAIALQRHSEPEPGVLALPELPNHAAAPGLPYCQAALHTRLFRSNGGGDFWPVHRTVAEYLGARYLAMRIQAGLPAKRVGALLLGEDGGVVPELRGLHAWLATTVVAGGTRAELIDNDPLGVVLHGDVRHFSLEDKRHLLYALHAEASRYTHFRSQNWTSKPFGALASADMQDDFKAALQSPDRSPAHLALLDCVLDAMTNGHPMPQLISDLERLVRDKTYWWPGMRTEALGIWIALTRQTNNWPPLLQLLADVHTNLVEDLEDELLGTLLQGLYPEQIATAELWRYFRQSKANNLLGAYWIFWNGLPQKFAPPQEVPTLLDSLVTSGYRPEGRFNHLAPSSEFVGKLLVHGVVRHGAQLEIERLSGWLSLGINAEFECALEQDEMASLAQWLSEHPDTYKALYEHYLHRPCEKNVGGYGMLSRASAQLFHAPEPNDANLWYLSLAAACESNDLRQALVLNAFHFVNRRNGPDAAIQLMEDWASHHVADADWVTSQLRNPYPPSESQQRHAAAKIDRRNRLTEESLQKIRFFSETLPSFSVGPAHLGALEAVANTYLNFSRRLREETPEARLFELLNHDAVWVERALTGLRHCLFREDLPSATSIVDLLHSQGRGYKLAKPCLAAMELRYADDPQSAFDLPQSTLESVITFSLIHSFGNTPAWFTQLLAQRPGVFAAPMAYLIGKQIAAQEEHAYGLFALANDTGYADVARKIVPTLIAALPIKTTKSQLYSVRLLIGALLKHLDPNTQLSIVEEKLSVRTMDVAQRVYWLATGMLLAPRLYLEPTRQFVAKAPARATHLFTLAHQLQERGNASLLLDAATQAFLIGTLGPLCVPDWVTASNAGGWVKPHMEMGHTVAALISSLASNPGDLALQALTKLHTKPNMAQWEDTLTRALYDQRVTRRKAQFKPANVVQICDTLANTTPANAADLYALTLDHLTQLSQEIRNGNTNDYRQYWAGAQPKKEDDCRDTLLSDLKRLLKPLLISAEPEGRYADEKRADIKVSFLPYQIPIEIKREMHADLWKAIPDQLIAKYSREMSSDGYGIYLVFWFNGLFKSAPTDGGAKPVTPQELQQRLASTVPEHLRNKIAILVVDCSKPSSSVAVNGTAGVG